MNVILLHSDHRHVSVTHVVIFRVVSKWITKKMWVLNCGIILTNYNFIGILALTTKDCGVSRRNTPW